MATFSFKSRFMEAAAQGDLTSVRDDLLLLKGTKELADALPYAFNKASEYGHIEVVRQLMEMFPRRVGESAALSNAAGGGHLDLVRLLLPVTNPRSGKSQALRVAALKNQLEAVRLLIPLSQPCADSSIALRMAAIEGHDRIMELLIPVSSIKMAAAEFIKREKWSALDRLARLAAPNLQERWLSRTPSGVLPLTMTIYRSHQRATALEKAVQPPHSRPRPRS